MIRPDPMIADTVRSLLSDGWKDGDEPASHQRTWTHAVSAGLHLIGAPEQRGGVGGTMADRVLVARQLGYHARDGAYLEVGAAAVALSEALDLDPETLAGARVALVAAGEHGTGPSSSAAEISSEGMRLLMVGPEAIHDAEPGQPVVGSGGASLAIISPVGPALGTTELADQVRDDLAILRAARLQGAALRAYELAVEHAATRQQFGRPIAKFQAVATLIADMRSLIDLTEAAVDSATGGAAEHRALRADGAARVATDAAGRIARTAHQVHGAIGITREHDLHRVTRRLWRWRDQLEGALAVTPRRRAVLEEAVLWESQRPDLEG